MPNFPYRGPLHRNSIQGFDLLTDYLFPRPSGDVSRASATETEEASDIPDVTSVTDSGEAPSPTEHEQDHGTEDIPLSPRAEFMLFLGDFIYADIPIYTGDDKEAYRRLYRRNYQSESFRKLYEKLREFCLEVNETHR
jgi:alkaline phosphatase D